MCFSGLTASAAVDSGRAELRIESKRTASIVQPWLRELWIPARPEKDAVGHGRFSSTCAPHSSAMSQRFFFMSLFGLSQKRKLGEASTQPAGNSGKRGQRSSYSNIVIDGLCSFAVHRASQTGLDFQSVFERALSGWEPLGGPAGRGARPLPDKYLACFLGMVQMPSEAHVLALRRLLLRLDDGSVVGAATKLNAPGSAQEFALVSAAHAYGLGRLSATDLSRAQFLLQELHGKVPDAEPLASLSGGSGALKRKTPDTLEVITC